MKIKSINTRQFAGLKNKEVKLEDGLNILVGNNESGKSTMVELIYQTLYRNSKLSKKEDKDFFTRFMPSDSAGDVVYGTLVFNTADGEYTLKKKWGASAECELVTPSGTIIANEDKIREIIAGELVYKKGLYDDVVFASQKSQENVVEHILEKLDKKAMAKQDLVSIISSEGISSTDGTAPEDIEKILQTKIDDLSGNWDFVTDSPKKRNGSNNRYKNGNGSIIEEYYKLEDLEELLRKSEITEKAIDNDYEKIKNATEKLNEYITENEDYNRYSVALATYKSDMALKEKCLEKKTEVKKAFEDYPNLLISFGEAKHLSTLKKARDVINKFNSIQDAKKKLDDTNEALKDKVEISDEDKKNLASLDKDIDKLQAKLTNLDLVANIKKLGNTDIIVKSVLTGETIDITSGEFEINETIEITIPGIMSMTIAAKGVDAEEVKQQLIDKNKERDDLLSKCRVVDFDDLITKQNDYKDASRNYNDAKKEYDALVKDVDIDELKNDYSRLKDKASELDGLDEKIKNLCGFEALEKFETRLDERIQSIEEKYGKKSTLDSIKKECEKVDEELETLITKEEAAASIPEKYRKIEDVDDYTNKLDQKIKGAEQEKEQAESMLRGHEEELGDVDTDDLKVQINDSENELQKLKDDYKRWNHILTVLRDTRSSMAGEKALADVRDRFAKYLSVITDGRIALKSMDENMDVNIQSADNPLNYAILSEGTKDTIALAFRLAMLEHLFPNGGGMVIFDDPFTEMDESRTKQACELVKKYADNNNQVIFVTCDTKYKKLLGGNTVEM